MSDLAKNVAKALVEIGAVGFVPDKPITFVSGIISPIYIENRRLPFYPDQWKVVLDAFAQHIEAMDDVEIIAGVEAAGIPHSATIGYLTGKPSVFVRKVAKDHGTKKMVEGGDVAGRNVLLIEDLVTLGGSSLKAISELRKAKAVVTKALVIVSYDFAESKQAFVDNHVELVALTTVKDILDMAVLMGRLSETDRRIVDVWHQSPWEWGK